MGSGSDDRGEKLHGMVNSSTHGVHMSGSSSCNLELWLHHYDIMVVAWGIGLGLGLGLA